MKKKIPYYVCLMMMFLPDWGGGVAFGKEVLRNGNFNQKMAHWTTLCTEVEAGGPETTYGGTRSANAVGEIDEFTCFYQDVCILPGVEYEFSMVASRRTAAPTPAVVSIKLRIEGLDLAGNVLATYVNMDIDRSNATFALTPVTGIPRFRPLSGSGVVKVRVSMTPLFSGSLGMVIDDLSLKEVDALSVVGSDTLCREVPGSFQVSNGPAAGVSYQWNFGSGATPPTSTDPNPMVSWSTSGSRVVTCRHGLVRRGSTDRTQHSAGTQYLSRQPDLPEGQHSPAAMVGIARRSSAVQSQLYGMSGAGGYSRSVDGLLCDFCRAMFPCRYGKSVCRQGEYPASFAGATGALSSRYHSPRSSNKRTAATAVVVLRSCGDPAIHRF
jgi:hypothetical protein